MMFRIIHYNTFLASALILFTLSLPVVAQEMFCDQYVQSPTLNGPQRGSITGAYAELSYGPGEMSRGSFALSWPISFPEERGPLLADIAPHYSPEAGLSEWGMGWRNSLSIERFRDRGDLDYETDDFQSPFGRLVQGTDQSWYVLGLKNKVQVLYDSENDQWEAVSPQGTRYTFGQIVEGTGGTFAWYLTEVESVVGEWTRLSYVENDSGRPFLSSVVYGAPGQEEATEIIFEYEELDVPLFSFRSGQELVLDRRITELKVQTKLSEESSTLRWKLILNHEFSSLGPAFYLTSIEKESATG